VSFRLDHFLSDNPIFVRIASLINRKLGQYGGK
jgi:hypothetical protein